MYLEKTTNMPQIIDKLSYIGDTIQYSYFYFIAMLQSIVDDFGT